MPEANSALLHGQERSNWIRLRTLILLRWVAIAGQLAAITVAQRMYSLQLEVGLCYLAIGVSVTGNLIAIFVFPENKRLTEPENFLMVLFDLLQLAFLLYLTGGLHNPFAMLLLGPVTISASVEGVSEDVAYAVAAFPAASLEIVGGLEEVRTGDVQDFELRAAGPDGEIVSDIPVTWTLAFRPAPNSAAAS